MLEVEVVPPGVRREPCIAIHGSAGGVRRIRHMGVEPSRLPTQRASRRATVQWPVVWLLQKKGKVQRWRVGE